MSILRIFICGAHSTGKSTLLNDLREYLDVQFEHEIARHVVRAKGFTRDDIDPEKHPDVFEDLQLSIIERQCKVDQQHCDSNTDYIADRGIDPLVYTALYLGNEARDRILATASANECIERYRSSLMFILKPFQECIRDDGVRLTPTMSELVTYTEIMAELMTSLNIPYHLIDTLKQSDRIKEVCRVVNKRKPAIVR